MITTGDSTAFKTTMSAVEEFKIEKVLKKRYKRGRLQYFIKWSGYPNSENSWNDNDDIKDRKHIRMFEKQLLREARDEDDDIAEWSSTKKLESPSSASKSLNRKSSISSNSYSIASTSSTNPSIVSKSSNLAQDGFPRGFCDGELRLKQGHKPKRIVGAACDDIGLVHYRVEWDDTQLESLIKSSILTEYQPDCLISYLQSLLTKSDDPIESSHSDSESTSTIDSE